MKIQSFLKKNDNANSLTRLYVFALSVVALLSIAGQILIQRSIWNELKDSYIINMAGRQRMLCQRICKNILLLESDRHRDKTYYLQDLRSSFEIWEKFQNGLHYGDTSIGLEGNNSEAINHMFRDQEPYFKEMASNIHLILSLYTPNTNSFIELPVKRVLASENQFLTRMNSIVNQYQQEAIEKDHSLMRIELILIFCTLMVLLLEGLFIFRPAALKIRQGFQELLFSESRTKEANAMLRKTQEELKNVNDQLEVKIQERTQEISLKNKELEEKNDQLARMNRDLDNFVYTASHDLKAPISNIEGLVEALTPEICKETGVTEKLVSLIKESVAKFLTVLRELSDTGKARVEASGKGERVNLKEVLDEIEFSMKGLIEVSGAIISDDFSAVPEINFSKKNMRSILYNLISNAIKYKSADRKPFIRVLSEKKDDHVVLMISDNGMGIKEEDISKMFSMYTRLTETVEGTGVGLTMVKRIIENGGGRIEVKSKFGEGSTFCVYFKIGP